MDTDCGIRADALVVVHPYPQRRQQSIRGMPGMSATRPSHPFGHCRLLHRQLRALPDALCGVLSRSGIGAVRPFPHSEERRKASGHLTMHGF